MTDLLTRIEAAKEGSRELIERETNRIASEYGCDRAVFTVCWGEIEKGLTCRCKAEAIAFVKAKEAKNE